MNFSQNYDNLLKHMNYKKDQRKLTHNNFKSSPLLPFQTDNSRVRFDNGFNSILGEFTRIELNKKLDNDFDVNQIIFSIIDSNSVNSDGNDKFLEKLLKEYLFDDDGELNILNPYLFSYIPLSKNKQSIGERNLALFLRDVFCQDNEKLVNFFEKNKTSHAVVNLILSNIPELKDNIVEKRYISVLDNIVKLFNEDINYAINYENFLINDISNIFSYYYFFYISQLILKINKDYDNHIGEIEEVYYLLDWESVSKNRKTVNGHGWDLLKNESNNLAAKISVIDQINILFGLDGYYLLDGIFEQYNDFSLENQQEFVKYLKKWIRDYQNARGIEEIVLPDDFKQLITILFDCLNSENGINHEIKSSRYPLNLEEVAKSFFAKGRGKYGFVLNITREMLLTLTALCVKNQKIKLNQLYMEYEKRGLYFDKYSKEEIEIFLTKLNLIDKKSDSGDAKYVRPIL